MCALDLIFFINIHLMVINSRKTVVIDIMKLVISFKIRLSFLDENVLSSELPEISAEFHFVCENSSMKFKYSKLILVCPFIFTFFTLWYKLSVLNWTII